MTYREAFSSRLAALCREKGLTQAALAARMNRTQQAVNKWINGLSQPSLEDVLRLSDLFGVSVEYLMTGYERGAMDIGRATGLTQRAMDDLAVWHTSPDVGDLVNYLLTRSAQLFAGQSASFSRIMANAATALDMEKRLYEEWQALQRDPGAPHTLGVPLAPGSSLSYQEISDGLIAQSGDIFAALLHAYVAEKMGKYRQHVERDA